MVKHTLKKASIRIIITVTIIVNIEYLIHNN